MRSSSAAPERRRWGGLWVAALALWMSSARADDSAGEPASAAGSETAGASAAAGEEIVVFGDIQVATARKKLDRELKSLGYRPGDRRDGRTVYRPETNWKPSVVVYDDGFVVLRRSPPRFEPWIEGKTRLVWLSCIPPFTLMCIKLSGWLVSPSRFEPQKERVASGVDPALRGWREAIIARNMATRINRDLPAAMDALWLEGIPLQPNQAPAPTPVERRAALLELWSSRACTPEGQAVRDLVAAFLAMEVQRSDWPASNAELRQAEQSQACGDRLVGPGLSDLDADRPAP